MQTGSKICASQSGTNLDETKMFHVDTQQNNIQYMVYHGVLENSALLTKNSTKRSVVKKLSRKGRAIKSCEKRTMYDKYRHQENLQWKAQKVNISQRST